MSTILQSLLLSKVLVCLLPAQAGMITIPQGFQPSSARMIVVLHGCMQSSELMAAGAGWNQMAEEKNLLILYPQVGRGHHPQDCWSYWKPENQRADGGDELEAVMREVQEMQQDYELQSSSTYIVGISSGGALAASLLACHPDQFAGAAVHSGVSYGLAMNQEEALLVQKNGPAHVSRRNSPCNPRSAQKPLFVIHGKSDPIVHYRHGAKIMEDFVGVLPIVSRVKVDGERLEIWDYQDGTRLRGRLVLVDGLGHAWSGSNKSLRHRTAQSPNSAMSWLPSFLNRGEPARVVLPFFADHGPNATEMMMQFFESTRSSR